MLVFSPGHQDFLSSPRPPLLRSSPLPLSRFFFLALPCPVYLPGTQALPEPQFFHFSVEDPPPLPSFPNFLCSLLRRFPETKEDFPSEERSPHFRADFTMHCVLWCLLFPETKFFLYDFSPSRACYTTKPPLYPPPL